MNVGRGHSDRLDLDQAGDVEHSSMPERSIADDHVDAVLGVSALSMALEALSREAAVSHAPR